MTFAVFLGRGTLEGEKTVIEFINSSSVLLEYFPGYRQPRCKDSYPPLSNIYTVAVQ